MNLSFQIICADLSLFLDHWSSKYTYTEEYKYDRNIGRPLTQTSRLELFEWKNGSVISKKKLESIINNYPLFFNGDQGLRYLSHKKAVAQFGIFLLTLFRTI